MTLWAKRLEVATNVAILCAFLLVAALAASRLFVHSANQPPHPTIGSKVSLQSAHWSNSNRTLVLALSTGCHFCSESAEFYRRLVPAAIHNGIRVIAILPQPVADGRAYLSHLDVPAPEVLQSSLDAVEVSGTPTLLLLDRQGRIEKAWVGKLDAEEEQQVLDGLH
jgi:hypothetical protein